MIGPVALALLVGPAEAITPGDVPNPRPDSWISDVADVLSPDQEAALDARIDALNTDLGVEIAVVTVPSVDEATPKQFATELFGAWGIGSAERDDGLLVLLAVAERRVEMETGYGLEGTLPDGWLGTLQADRMVPRFREGDLGGGLVVGVEAVDARLRAGPVAETPRPRPSRVGRLFTKALDIRLFAGFVFLLALAGWVGFATTAVRRMLGGASDDNDRDDDASGARRSRSGRRSGASSRSRSPTPSRPRTPKPPTPRSSSGSGGSKGGFRGGRSGGGGAGSSW